MSRRPAFICALILSALTASVAQRARAQAEPMSVTIVRRTAVRTAPNSGAPTIANVNPSTFEVKEFQLQSGFVRLLLAQIDRRRPSSGYGYIDTTDVSIDSGTTVAVRAHKDTVVRAPAPTPTPVAARPATVVPRRPDPVVIVRRDTLAPMRTAAPPRVATRRTTEITVRPDAPPSPPAGVDSPDLAFLRSGPLAAILQRPMSYPIGSTRDSIVVPAGFVAEFASIPRSLWTELSPVGAHERAAIVHDYLYWFQPCEREETDNLLMIAMQEENVADLQRGAVYAGVRIGSADAWNANASARDRGDLKVVPVQVRPTAQESWSDFRARLGKADIRGTTGRMPRQKFCDYGKSQQVP